MRYGLDMGSLFAAPPAHVVTHAGEALAFDRAPPPRGFGVSSAEEHPDPCVPGMGL